jgi:hypothetical protein
MRFITLLSLLPILIASPTPKPGPEAEPYNPFFPADYSAPSAPNDGALARRQGNLESRAALEQAGQARINAARAANGKAPLSKRLPEKSVRKIRRKHAKRACSVKTSTSVAPTATVTSSASATSASTTFIGGGAIAIPSASSVTPASSAAASSAVTSTSTSAAAPAATQYTVDPAGNGPFSGWGTWFDVGLSACGYYDTPGMPIVAVSDQLFDNWPGYDGSNPNNNPICGLHLDITWGGKTVRAEVSDRCPGCAVRSLDMSKGLFHEFADYSVGLLGMDDYTGNITWSWAPGTGRLPEVPY